MKLKKITFLLLSALSASAFAGNYQDQADVDNQNNKQNTNHFYIDVGAQGYYFDQPSMTLPYSVGEVNRHTPGTPWPSTPGDSYSADNADFSPSLTLGYQFSTDNPFLQKIFGQENAIELRTSYFHNSSYTKDDHDISYNVNNFPITGDTPEYNFDHSFHLLNDTVDINNTYADIGLYYTGEKLITNYLINSFSVGVDFNYLEQNNDHTETEVLFDDSIITNDPLMDGVGSDYLTSYYTGLDFADKLTYLFKNHYGSYIKLGAGAYWLHTNLDATETPVTNQDGRDAYDFETFPLLGETFKVNIADDKFTYKLKAEIGFNYYSKSNQDPMSPYLTFLLGVDYWNDVAYANNPKEAYQAVTIAYDSSINPYAGLQLHIPLA